MLSWHAAWISCGRPASSRSLKESSHEQSGRSRSSERTDRRRRHVHGGRENGTGRGLQHAAVGRPGSARSRTRYKPTCRAACHAGARAAACPFANGVSCDVACARPRCRRQDDARREGRSWTKSALIIGGSAASGAAVGGIVDGKKGALIGAAIGGGAASIYEATRRR